MADDTGTQESGATETVEPAVTSPVLPAMGDEEAPDDWSPPQTLADGTAVDGHGLPINLRLRKGALADAGKKEDPAGSVSPEDIAAEVERLKAYDADYPRIAANMKVADLEKIAKAEKVDLSSVENNEDRVALISASRPTRI